MRKRRAERQTCAFEACRMPGHGRTYGRPPRPWPRPEPALVPTPSQPLHPESEGAKLLLAAASKAYTLPLLGSAVHLHETGGTCYFHLSRPARRELRGGNFLTRGGVEGGAKGQPRNGAGWRLRVDMECVRGQRPLVQRQVPSAAAKAHAPDCLGKSASPTR